MSAIVTDRPDSLTVSTNKNMPSMGKPPQEVVTGAPENRPFSVTMATKPITGFNLKSFQVDLSKEALERVNADRQYLTN
ncbi:MAG: hypothetical protein HQL77_11555 [Magnetococcales bacterium]|nr:hypothetical protein [Magnetococcales bacterium]